MGKKPTGYVGTATIGDGKIEHRSIDFPDKKEEIEALVIRAFDGALPKSIREEFGIVSIQKTPAENDLDCILTGRVGKWRMDLVEFVPTKLPRDGHKTAPAIHSIGQTADRITDLICGKAEKYASVNPMPWLLMYHTAWQFLMGMDERTLVWHTMDKVRPRFERVFFINLSPDEGSEIVTLYPLDDAAKERVAAADLVALRASHTMNADLRLGQVIERDGMTVVSFPALTLRNGLTPSDK